MNGAERVPAQPSSIERIINNLSMEFNTRHYNKANESTEKNSIPNLLSFGFWNNSAQLLRRVHRKCLMNEILCTALCQISRFWTYANRSEFIRRINRSDLSSISRSLFNSMRMIIAAVYLHLTQHAVDYIHNRRSTSTSSTRTIIIWVRVRSCMCFTNTYGRGSHETKNTEITVPL